MVKFFWGFLYKVFVEEGGMRIVKEMASRHSIFLGFLVFFRGCRRDCNESGWIRTVHINFSLSGERVSDHLALATAALRAAISN